LKTGPKEKQFEDEIEVSKAAEEWFKPKPNTFYFEGLFKVKQRWHKCATLGGDCVEK